MLFFFSLPFFTFFLFHFSFCPSHFLIPFSSLTILSLVTVVMSRSSFPLFVRSFILYFIHLFIHSFVTFLSFFLLSSPFLSVFRPFFISPLIIFSSLCSSASNLTEYFRWREILESCTTGVTKIFKLMVTKMPEVAEVS